MRKVLRSRASLLIAVLVLLVSCVSRPKTKMAPELSQITAEPQHYLEVGDYEKAIAAYDLAYRAHPEVDGLLAAYVDSLEKIKREADRAFVAKDFSSAEKFYSLLIQSFPLFENFKMSLSFSPQGLSARVKDCRFHAARLRADRAIQTGDFLKAMEYWKSLLRAYPGDPESLAEFLGLSQEIQKKASSSLAQADFAAAGKAFYALAQNLELLEKFSPPPFSRRVLEEGIKTCRVELTRKGLEHYRKGRLAEAIRTWKDLLVFDPDNTEIQKAVETATEQLKKLKKEVSP